MTDDLLAGLRTQLSIPTPAHELDVVKRFGLHKGLLTPKRWEAVNDAIQRWKQNVLHGARDMPHQAYLQGHGQTTRFLRLLGTRAPMVTPAPDRATSEWLRWLLEHELTGTLDRYADDIRSAVLYGVQGETNPVNVASALYKATEAADRDWRLVAQTEMARANALGRLDGCVQMGYDEVWVPPHAGACAACKELIENRVFLASILKTNSNYGKKRAEWVPCIPLHPRCSHAALPYVEELYQEAQEQYAHMRDTGLDDEALSEMFDTSGQLRPQYAHNERLEAFFAGKTIRDPFDHMLGHVVEKVRSTGRVSKGFFDPPQVGLDPLVWEDKQLKPDVRTAILNFWTGVLGDGWREWAKVYITGSATSYQWGTGWAHPWLGSHHTPTYPDVDTHLVIDYAQVRKDRPLWAGMSPMELRKLLESWVKRAKADVEVAPGLRLDAYVRLEATEDEFERDIRHTGQGVYDVGGDAWVIGPAQPANGEYVKHGHMLAGTGGRLAHEHPEWVQHAERAGNELQDLLAAYQADRVPGTLEPLQALMDTLYDDRTIGFLDGNGQEDRGNFTWAYLSNFGPLQEVKELLAAG
jgi:hypothetical protein